MKMVLSASVLFQQRLGLARKSLVGLLLKKEGGAQRDLCPHCICYCHVDSPWAAEAAQQCGAGSCFDAPMDRLKRESLNTRATKGRLLSTT